MARLLLTIPIFVFAFFNGQAQSERLKFPRSTKLPDKFKKAIIVQTNEYNRLLFKDSVITKHYSVSFMLDKIDNDSTYYFIWLAEYWIAFHYQEIIPELIKRLTNKREVGLVNSADLIIWERVQANQMQLYGHGSTSEDDLFTVAGRANRLLKEITGENFGHVSMYSTKEQLLILQQAWTNWLRTM